MGDIDQVSGDVLDVALRLHCELGPGLMESVYEALWAGRLMRMGYAVVRQQPINIDFDGMKFDGAFQIDLMVDYRSIVEIKSIERLFTLYFKQLFTYLGLTNQPVGLFINFGGDTLKEGIRRLVNNHISASSAPLREPNQQE